MGIFSFRRRSKARPANEPMLIELRIPKVNEPEVTPETLRKQLFDAAAAGDEEQLTCLCQANEKSIFEQGLIWSKLPPEIRANPTLLRWYGNGLKAIAKFCSERLGKPELMDQVRQIEGLPSGEEARGEE